MTRINQRNHGGVETQDRTGTNGGLAEITQIRKRECLRKAVRKTNKEG